MTMHNEFWPDTGPESTVTPTSGRSRRRVVFAFDEGSLSSREELEQRGIAVSIPGGVTSLPGATPARKTASPGSTTERARRVSALSSSGLLKSFALALCSERIRTESAGTLPGLGGDSETSWSDLATRFCPSDCEPVVLGLSISGTGCSCLPRMPTPSANLFPCGDVAKLLARRERERAKRRNGNGFGLTLGQWVALKLFTPVASDWRGSTGPGSRRNTLAEQMAEAVGPNDGTTVYPHPEFVEAVMKFPISWTDCGG